MAGIDELRGKVPPEIEERLDLAVKKFRANHRHPANLALHAAGYFVILKGLGRFAHGKRFRAAFFVLFGLGMVLAGHEIEGTDAFAVLKTDQGPDGNGRS
ncbi:MAG: hypothetical protein WD826_02105 [Actinomycetota bacterium]